MKSRFQKGSGCYECRECGKKTRETGGHESDNDLCKLCDTAAELENSIFDNFPNVDLKSPFEHFKQFQTVEEMHQEFENLTKGKP